MSSSGLKPVMIMMPDMAVPAIAVEILPLGLHMTQILLNADGRSHDVLIGPFDPKDHAAKRGFLNCVVGRYCNRLPVGEFQLEKEGEKGTLKTISTESPTVSLHGGPDGFDRRVWTQLPPSYSKLFSRAEKLRLQSLDPDSVALFSLTSPAGDQGFPGELYTEVLFAVVPVPGGDPIRPGPEGIIDLGSVALVYRSQLAPNKPVACPINLTQHWGFNLSASIQPPQANPSVNTHALRIDSAGTIDLTPTFLATGNIKPTEKAGPWDHTGGKLVDERAPAKGYDEFYVFKEKQGEGQPIHLKRDEWEKSDLLEEIFAKPTKPGPVELYSNDSGIRAEFQTNQPGVQLYTGEGLNGSGTKKAIHGGSASGTGYNKRAAAFLEFHEPHAAWLHPWGSTPETDTIITSKDIYHNYTKVIFSYQHNR